MDSERTPWWAADRAAQFRAFADSDGRTAPLYRRLAEAAADDEEVLALLDVAPVSQQRTVLLFAAVHFLVLADPGCELGRFYPSVNPTAAAEARAAHLDPWPAFRQFCLERRDDLLAIIAANHTQTNEVGRVAALLPALHLVHQATGQPLTLLEVGASAGLNLGLDRYRVEYAAPSWEWPPFAANAGIGDPASPVVVQTRVVGERQVPLPRNGLAPPIRARVGLDLHPIDVNRDESVRWLEACVFPDRVDRLGRLRAAVEACRSDPPRVERGDAVLDLARVAATVRGEGPLVVMHSWALTYVEDREAFARAVSSLAVGYAGGAGRAGRDEERDVWWLSVEPSQAVPGLAVPSRDPRYTPAMAANTVTALMRVRPGSRSVRLLARSHPHLDWIHWLD